MIKKNRFKFKATVSDRGQIFIPKIVQNYFGIKSRDKVVFEVQDDGNIIFKKKTLKAYIPFGPFLSIGGLIAFFAGNYLVGWYAGLF